VDDSEIAEFRLAIGRVSRRLRTIYSEAKDDGDISFSELGILVRLSRDGPASPTDLAGKEGITAQAISLTLRSMLDRGLVERVRDDADRRRATVSVTLSGRDALSRRERALLGRLTDVIERDLNARQKADVPAMTEVLNIIARGL
jgi:DNA-binding MarR family transcriptional regulator